MRKVGVSDLLHSAHTSEYEWDLAAVFENA